jgi:PAS domain S-box-containing protein
MKLKSEVKLIHWGFVTALLILLSLSILSYRLYKKDLEQEVIVKNAFEVLGTSKTLLFNLKDGETSFRGFMITGNEEFLIPFHNSITLNKKLLSLLKQRTLLNPLQQKRYTIIERLIRKKYAFANASIKIRREKGLEAVLPIINSGEGRKIMDQIQSVFVRMDQGEQNILIHRNAETRSHRNINEFLLLYGIFLSGAIFLFIFLVLRRQIRSRVKSEQELFIKNEWFSQTLISLGDGVITIDTHGIITLINQAACDISKWSKEEAIGKHVDIVFEIFNEATGLKVSNPAIEALQKNHTSFLPKDTFLKLKDGMRVYIDDSGAPIHNNEGKIIGAVLIFRDISDTRKAEEERTQYKNFLEAILENIPSMIFIKSAVDLKFLKINKAGEELLGFSREELLGKNDHDFFNKQEADFFSKIDQEVLDKGSMVDIPEEVINTPTGERWLHTRKIPIYNRNGDPDFLIGVSEDITVERMLQAELKDIRAGLEQKVKERTAEIIRQKKFTENILNNIPNDIAVFDSDHNYLFVNPAGIANKDIRHWLIGKNDFDYCTLKNMDDSSARKRRQVFEKSIRNKSSTEWVEEHTGKEGDIRHILRKFHPIFENEKLINVIGYGLDVTELKAAEQVKKDYILALEEMMFMTSHKLRQPVSQIMGISVLLESEISSQEELKAITGYMQQSILNLDSFSRELTSFINELREKSDQSALVDK